MVSRKGMGKIKIGIVGCGTIGEQLAFAIEKQFSRQARLVALCDIDDRKAQGLRARLRTHPALLSIDGLIKKSDLIIEAAAAEIAYEIARKSLQRGRIVLVMSTGGILEKYNRLRTLAQSKAGRIYLPSGALCGLDAVKSAATAGINSVRLITRKPPRSLSGIPYLMKRKIDLSRIRGETVLFEGTASRAVKAFPKNINVCAVLSLAGIGPEKTKVKIITSPKYGANSHEIQLEGDFGRLIARTENLPSPGNPKTSFLASLSAVATLKDILDVVKIGT